MKQLFAILAAVLITASVFAQSPEKMSYQAVVRDVSQTLITNQSVGMQISILQGSPTGTVVYSETQTPTTNINGLLSIEIGDGVGFNTIDWANGPYFLKTEIDPTGGTNYSITGTSQLLSVPYALYAKTADSISGTIVETDPIFGVSVAAGITETDTTYWNNKLDIEIDGDTTNELQYLSLVSDTIIFLVPNGGFVVLPPETDPVFGASVAAGITQTDTTYWNNKIDVETDPIFGASVASGITSGDTAYWNNKLDSYTETDPIFGASVAAGITGTDTTYWNNKLDVETDPIFGASVAANITQTDTTNWNTAFNWGDHSVAGYFANGGEATGADRTLGNTDNYSLGLKSNNATRLLIANDGNIGIGTTTPTEKLHIVGNNSYQGTNIVHDNNDRPSLFISGSFPNIILGSNGNSNHGSTIGFWNYDGSSTTYQWNMGGGQDGNFSIGFAMNSSNPHCGINYYTATCTNAITPFLIDPTGRVGIGIQNPSEKLSVSGLIESTTGGFKFPDGTVQTTAATASSVLPPGMIVPFAGDAAHVPQGWLICDGSAISRTTYVNLFNMIGTNYGSGNNSTTFNLPDLRGMFLRGADNGSGNDPDAGSRTASNPGGNTGDNVGSIQFFASSLPTNPFSANLAGNHNHTGTISSAGGHNHSGNTTQSGNHSHYLEKPNGGAWCWIPMNYGWGLQTSYVLYAGWNSQQLNTNITGNHQHTFTTSTSGNHIHGMTINNNGSHSHTISGGDSETRPVNVYVNYIIKY
ncbi:MAG: tail fiber protein [Bacteroidales bacterium]|nr:tail fiber protein [Bacteroidales bacterium]